MTSTAHYDDELLAELIARAAKAGDDTRNDAGRSLGSAFTALAYTAAVTADAVHDPTPEAWAGLRVWAVRLAAALLEVARSYDSLFRETPTDSADELRDLLDPYPDLRWNWNTQPEPVACLVRWWSAVGPDLPNVGLGAALPPGASRDSRAPFVRSCLTVVRDLLDLAAWIKAEGLEDEGPPAPSVTP